MDLGLDGKAAIITGGSAGIGLACAAALVREGARVVIAARNPVRLEAACQELDQLGRNGAESVFAVAADLASAADAHRLVDRARAVLGHVDILVNNAGSARAGNFFELTDDDFESAWRLKFLGYVRMIRMIAPLMVEQRDGRIVNVVGGAARTPRPTFLPGSTTNAAVLNFSRGIAKELAPFNVRVNVVSPGNTATERAVRLARQEAAAAGADIDEVLARRVASIPIGRLVEPAEIARVVALLASDVFASTTGAEIVVDGGQMPGL